MQKWEICEIECLKFLQNKYGNEIFKFEREGGSDSTKPDIVLKENGKKILAIEVKMKKAQCGQFVAFPNNKDKSFDYSTQNNENSNYIYANEILDEMAKDYERYKNPDTKGVELEIDSCYFYTWVCEFYKNKGVKYFIVEKETEVKNLNADNFVIIPIASFEKYFKLTALYRRKRSGSYDPSINNFSEIEETLLSEGFKLEKIEKIGKHVYATFVAKKDIYKIPSTTKRFQFKGVQDNYFKVTILSKTCNPNIIFSLELISDQRKIDLEKFEREFL